MLTDLPIARCAGKKIPYRAAFERGSDVSECESGFLCLGFAAESGLAGKLGNRAILGARRERRITRRIERREDGLPSCGGRPAAGLGPARRRPHGWRDRGPRQAASATERP